jgi:eukaryotic-like serine/threonine-protein kinase
MSAVDLTSDPSPLLATKLRHFVDEAIAGGRATSVISQSNARRTPANAEAVWPRVRGYDILSMIGCGGMGLVFKARQRGLNRIVALKTLRGTGVADDESRERFRSEAEAVARLQHPNIVQVFEVGVADSFANSQPNPFIALEFVDGGNLIQRTGKPQSPRDAAGMVVKLARAVEAAHRVGIVHRDLKPANVLLTQGGEPKIADFGLAKQLDTAMDSTGRFLTQAGTVVGTPEYMSPEQAAGATPTPAVDIYALGIILYELLTARVPFQAANPVETMDLVRHQEAVSPRTLQPNIPCDLDTICLKCLEKDPARRYASADALADDLQRFLDRRSIHARRVSRVGKAWRWCRRNPIASLSLLCVASMFLTAFAAVTRSYWRAEGASQQAIERARAERLENYFANIAAAESALQVCNIDRARRTLDAAPEEHRDWEWSYFRGRLDLTTHVSETMDAASGRVRLSISGRHAVRSHGENGQVIWDTIGRQELRALRAIGDYAFCQDERAIVVRQPDHSVAIFDIATGTCQHVLHDSSRSAPAIGASANGERIATKTEDERISIWNASDGRLVQKFAAPREILMGLQLSPDGRYLAADQDRGTAVAVWQTDTGKLLANLPGHKNGLLGIAFNFAGDRILTIEAFPANVARLWEASTGRLVATLQGHRNTIAGYAFSPDDAHVATCSLDQTVRVWNGRNGQSVATLRGHFRQVNAIAFRSDGKRIASASSDHTIRTWDVPTGDLITVLPGHAHEVSKVCYLPDGGIVSAGQDGTICNWDAQTVEGDGVLRGHSSFVYGVDFHPDGRRVASASWDGAVRVWDATSGRQLAAFQHGDKAIVTSVAFHPDGKILVSRSRDSVRLWDLASGRELHRWTIPSGGWKDTRVAFNADGTLIAAGCTGSEIRVWNVANHQEVARLQPKTDEVRDVAFSPDGRFLVAAMDGGDRRVLVWDSARWELVKALEGHQAGCYAVAFNRDGSLLASSSTDATVRLWSTTDWKEAAVLKHDVPVYGVAFSADGRRLVSACADSSMRFWDIQTHREVAELRGDHQYYHQVKFSPDGTRLLGACGDCTVRVWDNQRARVPAAVEPRR